MNNPETPIYSLWQLILYFLRLGTFGFGGPVALVGYMHRDLVEGKGWITESDYKEGLALSQIAPVFICVINTVTNQSKSPSLS